MNKRIGSFFLFACFLLTLVSCITANRVVRNPDYQPIIDPAELPVVPMIQTGHTRSIRDVAWHPDGSRYATVSEDGNAMLWRNDGVLLRRFAPSDAGAGEPVAVAFHPTKELIAVGSDGLLDVFDVISGALIWHEKLEKKTPTDIKFNRDGRYMAIAATSRAWHRDGGDYIVRIYDMNSSLPVYATDINSNNAHLAFSPSGTTLFAGTDAGDIVAIDIETKKRSTVTTLNIAVESLACHPHDELLAVGHANTMTIVGHDGEIVATHRLLSSAGTDTAVRTAFSHDGSRCLLVRSKTANVLRLSDGELLDQFVRPKYADDFEAASWSPDDASVLLSAGGGGDADAGIFFYEWDLATGASRAISNAIAKPVTIVASPEGNSMLVATNIGISEIALDPSGVSVLRRTDEPAVAVSLDPAGGRYVAATERLLKFRDLESHRVVGQFSSQFDQFMDIGGCEWSPDGRHLALYANAWYQNECTAYLVLWDAVSEERVNYTTFPHTRLMSVTFMPSGTEVMLHITDQTTDQEELRYWSVDSWEPVKKKAIPINANHIHDIVFSHDGRYMIIGHGYERTESERFRGSVVNIETMEMTNTIQLRKDPYRLAPSPVGPYVAAAMRDGATVIIDYRTGSISVELPGTIGEVESMAWSDDGAYLFAAGTDGVIRVWHIDTRSTLNIVLLEGSEWFAYTDGGLFDTSPDGLRYLKFVRGSEVYEPEQFWNEVFTPGLLASYFGGAPLREVNLAEAARNVPEVAILSPEDAQRITSEDGIVTVRCTATQQSGGIGDVFLYHNGRAINEKSRGLAARNVERVWELELRLVPGANTIRAAAFDSDHQVEGKSKEITITYVPPEIVRPDMHVVSFGVSHYQDPGISLVSPVDDALEISQLFQVTATTVYETVNTVVLTDAQVTRTGIVDAIESLVDEVTVDDTVIMFFAGHGFVEDGVYYYFPFEADIVDIPGTCLSVEVIGEFLDALTANKVAIFFDTCQSGGAAKSLGQVAMARGIEERKVIADLSKQKGIIVFAAAGHDEAAYEIRDLGNGIFTHSILELVKHGGASVTVDGYISMGKLLAEAEKMSRAIAWEYLGVEQNPIRYSFGADFYIGKAE